MEEGFSRSVATELPVRKFAGSVLIGHMPGRGTTTSECVDCEEVFPTIAINEGPPGTAEA